jgi:hypothetical protein
MGAGGAPADNESAVNTAAPPTDGRAVTRLLEHCVRVAGVAEARPRARERLEAVLGGELTNRLVGALAGDHASPGRLFVG